MLAPEGISNYDVRNKLFYVFFTKRVITQQGNISPAMMYAIHGYKKIQYIHCSAHTTKSKALTNRYIEKKNIEKTW